MHMYIVIFAITRLSASAKKKKLEVAVIKCSFAIPFRLYFSSFSSYENRNAKTSYACVSTRVVCLCYMINKCILIDLYRYPARRVWLSVKRDC